MGKLLGGTLKTIALNRFEDRCGAELQRVHRDALVRPMNGPGEVETPGKLHGQEAISLDAKPREEAGIGDCSEQEGNGRAVRVCLPQDAAQGGEQSHVQLGRTRIVSDDFEVNLGT